jgi:hypothetical protein
MQCLILLVCFIFIVSIIIGCVGHHILIQGVIDEISYPLGNCDTSIFEEVMEERGKQN